MLIINDIYIRVILASNAAVRRSCQYTNNVIKARTFLYIIYWCLLYKNRKETSLVEREIYDDVNRDAHRNTRFGGFKNQCL